MNPTDLSALQAGDRAYVERVPDARLRETIVASLTQYRRVPQVRVGEVVPALPLTRLVDGRMTRLTELVGAQPLMLIFGSIT